MADTETIRADDRLARNDPKTMGHEQTLTLAAIDDAFQEHVRTLFNVACAAGPEDHEAIDRAMNGYRRGIATRAALRKRINGSGD